MKIFIESNLCMEQSFVWGEVTLSMGRSDVGGGEMIGYRTHTLSLVAFLCD